MPNSSYRPVLLIELDDRESSVEGFSLFYDPRDIKITSFNETLVMTYIFDNFNISKRIVAHDGNIKIIFELPRDAHLNVAFKGKNYTYANGVEVSTIRGRSVEFNNITELKFKLENRFIGEGGGSLRFSTSVNVKTTASLESITDISIEFVGEYLEIEIIRGYTSPVMVSSVTHTIPSLLNHRTVQLLLPIASIIAVAIGWTIWRALKLAFVAVIPRLLVAPLFAHLWDVKVLQETAYYTLKGYNIYNLVYTMSRDIAESTGQPIFYEGYAYPPHLILVIPPFYMLYLVLGGDPQPIKIPEAIGTSLIYELQFSLSKDVFLFLIKIKNPYDTS